MPPESMRTSDFDYPLPPELIAQTPLEPRDASRLLTLDRKMGGMEHRQFSHILEYLRPGDLMVFNRSRVIPARLHAHRPETGGKVELLLLRRQSPGVWEALGRPGRRMRSGSRFLLDTPNSETGYASTGLGGDDSEIGEAPEVEVLESGTGGVKLVRFSSEAGIERWGETPLPPYIRQPAADPERYQTVYSTDPGSVAAPTAGLHFTPPLLEQIRQMGVEQTFVTLHIGLDTFRPVQGDDPTEHRIHTEYYEVSAEAAGQITRARREGRRIIAVGTTSVRTLEQLGRDWQCSGPTEVQPTAGQADIFILPGHRFRLVDAMITNFHLPRSTLLMLVSAFAGRELVLSTYREAIAREYRFFSFGDAMFIH
jgi:S-adenosylmethionine:tRNA ribosyltransferase-isomerase